MEAKSVGQKTRRESVSINWELYCGRCKWSSSHQAYSGMEKRLTKCSQLENCPAKGGRSSCARDGHLLYVSTALEAHAEKTPAARFSSGCTRDVCLKNSFQCEMPHTARRSAGLAFEAGANGETEPRPAQRGNFARLVVAPSLRAAASPRLGIGVGLCDVCRTMTNNGPLSPMGLQFRFRMSAAACPDYHNALMERTKAGRRGAQK